MCSVMGWCECNQRSNSSTAHCISYFSSPPSANLKDGAAWNFLYAATEEAARMRMIQVGNKFYRADEVPVPPKKPGPVTAPFKTTNYGPWDFDKSKPPFISAITSHPSMHSSSKFFHC
ncbi:Uncharacterized protein Adt_17311 [Abeliophyllum distichum]|uniref:Uncharacterized protein n=1 Tax=Abeliophyllum distichum TaxID=126358 RepID=A0ABD1TG46_9LAMI